MDQEEYDRLVQVQKEVKTKIAVLHKELQKKEKKLEFNDGHEKWYRAKILFPQELCMDIFILVLGLIGLAMWKELGIILLLLDAIMWGVTVWCIWLENKREEESVRLEQEIAELKKQIEILNNSIYDEK